MNDPLDALQGEILSCVATVTVSYRGAGGPYERSIRINSTDTDYSAMQQNTRGSASGPRAGHFLALQ